MKNNELSKPVSFDNDLLQIFIARERQSNIAAKIFSMSNRDVFQLSECTSFL
jgi:hypothetical protein